MHDIYQSVFNGSSSDASDSKNSSNGQEEMRKAISSLFDHCVEFDNLDALSSTNASTAALANVMIHQRLPACYDFVADVAKIILHVPEVSTPKPYRR